MPTADATVWERWRAHRTGLAPYYPLLYSLVIGMGARRVFEFGTGESSTVLLSALLQTGGRLVTCSPDVPTMPEDDRLRDYPDNWITWRMLSSDVWNELGPFDVFDLVLHDGSHSAAVVAADLIGILPRVRVGGLVLIHDTLHSYVGAQMRAGVRDGTILERCGVVVETGITLPFAFGLQVLQVTVNHALRQVAHPFEDGPVSIGPDKPSSPHRTLRWGEHA